MAIGLNPTAIPTPAPAPMATLFDELPTSVGVVEAVAVGELMVGLERGVEVRAVVEGVVVVVDALVVLVAAAKAFSDDAFTVATMVPVGHALYKRSADILVAVEQKCTNAQC